jgi:hypothetical protein
VPPLSPRDRRAFALKSNVIRKSKDIVGQKLWDVAPGFENYLRWLRIRRSY